MTQYFDYQGFGAFSEWNGQLASANAAGQMKAIAATGSNSIAITPRYWVETGSSNTVLSHEAKTDTDASILAGIKAAQAAGLTVIMKPAVTGLDGTDSQAFTPTDVKAFFASYTDYIVHMATLAQQAGVQMFSVGNEMFSLSGAAYRSEWVDVIAAVRQVYSGQVTYASATNEASSVSFWDQVDVIGFNAYPTLSNSLNPTIDELKAAWTSVPTDNYWAHVMDQKSVVDFVHSLAETYGKQVLLTEVGYRSIDGGATNPGQWYRDGVSDVADQANAYQAALEVWTSEGGSWLAGLEFFHWGLSDKYSDTGYSPEGKPAQTIVTNFFKGTASASGLTVAGSAVSDLIDIGNGSDKIFGGLGNDIIRGGAGDDVIVAGPETIARLSSTTVTFSAYGTLGLDGEPAKVQIWLNGKQVGAEITLTPASDPSAYQTYSITFDNPTTLDGLEFVLMNAGPGRGAFFRGVEVNGYTLKPSDVINKASPETFNLYVNSIRLDGTAHADLFYGAGEDNDLIQGGKGDDTIDGGAGIDTAVYAGAAADYTMSYANGVLTVHDGIANRDGVDTLTNVEYLRFADGQVAVSSIVANGVIPAPLVLTSALSAGAAGGEPQLKVSGLSVAGATVTLYDGLSAIGTAVADATGAYLINLPSVAVGSYTLGVKATHDGVTSAATGAGAYIVSTAASVVGDVTGKSPSAVWIVDNQHPIVLTVAQMDATASALSNSLTAYTLKISDSAANVMSSLSALSLNTTVSAIVIEGSPVFVMASHSAMNQAITKQGAALDKIVGDFTFQVTTTNGANTTVGAYGEDGKMISETTTIVTAAGKQVYAVYGDGHSLLTTYSPTGEKLTESFHDGAVKQYSEWGLNGRGYASQVTHYVNEQMVGSEQYRADGTVYGKTAISGTSKTTEIYDANGHLGERTVAASGVTTVTSFVNDVKASQTVTDASGKHFTQYGVTGKPYVVQDMNYDAQGKLISTFQYRADGGVYSSVINKADGSKVTDVYDAAGKLEQHAVVASNGYATTTLYANGAKTSETVIDGTGKHVSYYGVVGRPYTTQTFDYDSSGKLLSVEQYRADGSQYGSIVYKADGSTITDIYAAGRLEQHVVAYANGNSATTLYANGVKTTDTVVDGAGKHVTYYGITGKPYVTQTFDYNATGKLLSVEQYRSNGIQYGAIVYKADGSTVTDLFNASGRLEQHSIAYANGYSANGLYTNGVKTSETIIDGTGKHAFYYGITSKPYVTQVFHYDAAGKLLTVQQYKADGSQYALITYNANGSTTVTNPVGTLPISPLDAVTAPLAEAASKPVVEAPAAAPVIQPTVTATYANGVKTTETLIDTAGKHLTYFGVSGKPYASQTLDYNASGKLVSTEQYRADGSKYGVITYKTDGSTVTDMFDASGKVSQHLVKYADGDTSSTLYANGVKLSETVIDETGTHLTQFGVTSKPYATQTLDYDTSGRLVSTEQYRADGSHYATIAYKADGGKVSELFDAAGRLTQHTELRADQSSDTVTYDATGHKTSDLLIDAAGKYLTQFGITGKPYDAQTVNSTIAGKITDIVQHNTDGTKTVTAYVAKLTLESTTANETFKSFGSDVFHFKNNFGNDTIQNFHATGANADKIWIDMTSVHSFQDLKIWVVGADTMIQADHSTIKLANVTHGVDANDFLFG